ncbi:MAG: hypothetical protein OEY34_02185 [Cyclobacteriaceae bacterium]|nr:hypothetical protein [Cyclobacteriaceae bacterium]
MKTITNKFKLVAVLGLAFLVLPLIAQQQRDLQYFRYNDKRGINVFETKKEDSVKFDGVKVVVGGAFTQQYQNLKHSTEFVPTLPPDDPNLGSQLLKEISPGFNNATANLNLDVQLDDGIRLKLVTYLSARHHTETWVKGGYIQFDKLPFNSALIDGLMENLTIKIGHMEVNYGDAHFRRTDNGNAIYNPFVGNYIMDAFTTEIGGEIYYQNSMGILGMVGLTEGLIKGDASGTFEQKPSLYFKFGYDKQINDLVRFRLTGSMMNAGQTERNTIYGGDRTGSRYYYALEPQLTMDRATKQYVSVTATNRFTSGRFNPGFNNKINSIVLNPFVKVGGLEVFGMYETSKGSSSKESVDRKVSQMSGELLYRFLADESIYLGTRYNKVSGELSTSLPDASISRFQIVGGWFINDHVLAKFEYVNQQHKNFTGDLLEGGKFNGWVLEAVIGF